MGQVASMLASCSGQTYRMRGSGLITSVHGTTRRTTAVASAVLAVALVSVVGCSSSSTDGPAPQVASSSSDPAALPTPAGTVPDSIEDLNSTKDMTGVVTTYSNDENPYIKLVPYVCPFLPDSLTRDKLGMETKQTGFGGQHTLLQVCSMLGPSGPHYEQLTITVTVQATSFGDVSSSPTHTDIERNVPVWRDVTGVLYKNEGDNQPTALYCNLAWGTFYGSAVVSVAANSRYQADPCEKAKQFSPLIAAFLPSKPTQMRPTEG